MLQGSGFALVAVLLMCLPAKAAGCALQEDDGSDACERYRTSGAAFASPPQQEASERLVLSGTVTYYQRIALVPGSVVEVRVDDITRADTPATTTGSVRIKPADQVPIPFEVELPEGWTDPQATYAVTARIYGPDGELLFASDRPRRVPAGAVLDQIDLVLAPAGGAM